MWEGFGHGSLSHGSATVTRLRCEVLATPGGNIHLLQPTTSINSGRKIIKNVLASSLIYLFAGVYTMFKSEMSKF